MNGEIIETVEGDIAIFDLVSESDAAYVVIAEGDQSMSPVRSGLPWAMTSAFLVDVTGDGWRAAPASLANTLLNWTTLVDGGTPNGNRIGTELYLTA